MDADGRPLSARDRDQSDAGELRQFRHEARFDDVFDVGELHRFRSDAKRQNRRVGRIDLGVDRRRRQIGGQKIAGGVDRLLDLLLRNVETDVEAEPQGDDRGAGGARRHHLAETRHLAELPLERRRHRRSHHLRARAWIEGLDLNRRIVDLGQGRERQEAKGHDSDEQNRDHQKTGRDRPIDKDAGRVHRSVLKAHELIALNPAPARRREPRSVSTRPASGRRMARRPGWSGWRAPARSKTARPALPLDWTRRPRAPDWSRRRAGRNPQPRPPDRGAACDAVRRRSSTPPRNPRRPTPGPLRSQPAHSLRAHGPPL